VVVTREQVLSILHDLAKTDRERTLKIIEELKLNHEKEKEIEQNTKRGD